MNVNSSSLNPIGEGNFDLHVLSGLGENEESVAHDVNDSDIAVGWATFEGIKHAVVWRIDQYDASQPEGERIPKVDLKLLNINDSTFSEAFAINDDTTPIIVGVGDVLDDCGCSGSRNFLLGRGFWRTLTDPP